MIFFKVIESKKKWKIIQILLLEIVVCPVAEGNILLNLNKEKQSSPCGTVSNRKVLEKNIEKLCRIKCESDNLCELLKTLNVFLFFSNYIRQRNIERNDVVPKIMIRENCKHPYCLNSWCFEVYET